MVSINEVIYFGYELELLEAHIAEHRPYVNRLIVAENSVTITGHKKPLYAKDNWSRFEKYDVEYVEMPAAGFNTVTQSTEEEATKTGAVKWRFQGQDKYKKEYMHPNAIEGADWVLHSDTDEILFADKWGQIKEGLNPAWNHASMKLVGAAGHINVKIGKKTFPYRWARAKEGFSVANPKHPVRQPRGEIPAGTVGTHFFACYSRPEEFYWKFVNRPWMWTTYGDDIPSLEEGCTIIEKYLQNWGSFYKTSPDNPLLKYIKTLVPDDPDFWTSYLETEEKYEYIRENIRLFPHVKNGRAIRASV